MVCVVVRALPLCGPASIELPGLGTIQGMSLLVFFSAMRVFNGSRLSKSIIWFERYARCASVYAYQFDGATQEKINKMFAL